MFNKRTKIVDMKTASIKINSELKKALEQYQQAKGIASISDVIELAFNTLDRQTASEKPTNNRQKLVKMFEAIKEYNEGQKAGEKVFFPFPTAYFLNKQTGLNRSRDIKPFVDDYKTVIEKMHKDCKIEKGYKLHPKLQIENENGKNIFFSELWEKAIM